MRPGFDTLQLFFSETSNVRSFYSVLFGALRRTPRVIVREAARSRDFRLTDQARSNASRISPDVADAPKIFTKGPIRGPSDWPNTTS